MKIQKDFAEAKESNDVAIQRAKFLEIIANCNKLLADKNVSEEMKEKLEADKKLAQEMVNTEKAKQRNLDSNTKYNDAQTKTEDDLRTLRKSLTYNQVKEVAQKIRESRVLTAEGIEKFIAWLKGDRDAGSMFGFIDKYVSGAGKQMLNNQTQYAGDIKNYLYSLMSDVGELK